MKGIEKRSKIKIDITQILAMLIIYILNCCTSEFFKIGGLTIVLLLVSFFVWLYFATSSDRSLLYYFLKISWPLFGCIALLLLFSVVDLSPLHVSLSFENIIYFMMLLALFLYYSRNWNERQGRAVVIFWSVDTVISCIYSIYRLKDNPMLARDMAASVAEGDVRGIVSYGVVYGLTILVPVLCWMIFKKNNRKKFLWVALFAIVILTLWYAQFTISLFLLLVGIVLYLLYNVVTRLKKLTRILVLIFSIAVIAIVATRIDEILMAILEVNNLPKDFSMRLGEILKFLQDGHVDNTNDAALRVELYQSSVKAISQNGFLGYCLFGKGSVGGHSEILDMLANYGVIYFVLFMSAITKFYQKVIAFLPNECRGVFRISTLLLLVQSFINTSFMSSIMGIYIVVIPLLLKCYGKEKGANI